MRWITLLGALLALVGCTPYGASTFVRVDWPYDHFREVCASAYDPAHPSTLAAPQPFSAECMTVVGDQMGVDWASFGDVPHDVDPLPSSSLENLVWGAIAASGDVGFSIGTLGRSDGPVGWAAFVAESAAQAGLSESENAGALLYALISTSFDRTLYDPDMEGTWAKVDADSSTLTVGLIGAEEVENPVTAYPYPNDFEVTSLVVHEIAHFAYEGHYPCPFDEAELCDATPEGAFGVEVWWAQLLLERSLGEEYEWNPPCGDIFPTCDRRCEFIVDVSGFPACDEGDDGTSLCRELLDTCYEAWHEAH
jgi:hypothetical protein